MIEAREFLFVCVENAGRSQMAEAFFMKYAPPGFRARSAGTRPESEVNPVVAEAMSEAGIDISRKRPRLLTQEMIRSSVPVNMGCVEEDACPVLFAGGMRDWNIPDPKGKTIDQVREIRDMIESKVKELVARLEEP